ncbi:hypothetical protein ACHAW6_014508, partial [Cyclotella cf. meneghiniana]
KIHPEKSDPNRTRIITGGDKCNYPFAVATPTAEMLVAKILFNNVISTPGTCFMTMDISNFYRMTSLLWSKYICIKLMDVLDEIIHQYGLCQKANKAGMIHMVISKGIKFVPGLWKHHSRPITFCLTVDDFGIKYIGQEHAEHLLHVLSADYKVTCDWSGTRYIGIHLHWDCTNHRVHLFMPSYVKKALTIFNHTPSKPESQPWPQRPIKYGCKNSNMPSHLPLPQPLTRKARIKQVCGKFLYLGHAMDSTLLVPISAISTRDTLAQTSQLLNYLATQEDAVLTFT